MKGAMKNCKIWLYESASQIVTNSCNLDQARKVLLNASFVPGRQQCSEVSFGSDGDTAL